MQKIIIPNVGEFNFPDNISDDEIKAAIHREILPKHAANTGTPHGPSSNPSLQHPSLLNRIGNNTLQFAEGAGAELANAPANLYNMIAPKSLNVGLLPEPDSTAGKLGSFAGDIGSFAMGGEAAGGARLAAESIPYIQKIAKALSGIGGRALGSGVYGAAQNPNSRIAGAALGAGASGVTDGASALIGLVKKLKPSNLFDSGLSKEELERNLSVAKGTKTPLGDVIGSPFLKRAYENDLSKKVGSGADKVMTETANQLTGKSNALLNHYLGGEDSTEVNQKILNALKRESAKQEKVKTQLYKPVNDIADEIDLKLVLPEFSGLAKKYSSLIKDQHFLKFEPESQELLSRLSKYKNPVKKNGDDEKFPSLFESNVLAGKLRSLSEGYKSSPLPDDRFKSEILSKLSSALKSDIKNSIHESGNEKLLGAFNDAERNYKENFSPFLEKDIYKFTHGGKDPDDIVSAFIKTGRNTDKGNQLNKLMSKLSPKEQNLVKYSYLSRAIKGNDGEEFVDPRVLRNLWSRNNLGPNQKSALVPDTKERKALNNFSQLIGMNEEALSRMLNPKTGQRGLESVPKAMAAVGTLGAHGFAAKTGAALLGALAQAGLGNIAVKKLTSEATREKIVKSLIEKQFKQPKSNTAKNLARKITAPAAVQLLNSHLNGGQ